MVNPLIAARSTNGPPATSRFNYILDGYVGKELKDEFLGVIRQSKGDGVIKQTNLSPTLAKYN